MGALGDTVLQAVSKGEINDILAQLPPEFDRFFQEAVEGPMPS